MRTHRHRPVRLRPAATAAAAVALGVVATATPALATPEQNSFTFKDASYILTLRAGGVEAYEQIPRDLPTDYGHSYVDLIHDIGQDNGRCEAIGAGYWLGQEVERVCSDRVPPRPTPAMCPAGTRIRPSPAT